MVTFGPLLTPTSGHTGLSLDVANIFLVLFERAKASSSLHKMTIPMITSVQIKLTQFANIRIEAFLSFCSRRRTKRNVFAGVRAVSRNEAAHSGKNTLPPKVAWKLIFVRSRGCKFVRGRATYFDFTTFLSLKRQERTKEKEKVCEPPKKFFHKKFEMNLSPWIFLLPAKTFHLTSRWCP